MYHLERSSKFVCPYSQPGWEYSIPDHNTLKTTYNKCNWAIPIGLIVCHTSNVGLYFVRDFLYQELTWSNIFGDAKNGHL